MNTSQLSHFLSSLINHEKLLAMGVKKKKKIVWSNSLIILYSDDNSSTPIVLELIVFTYEFSFYVGTGMPTSYTH